MYHTKKIALKLSSLLALDALFDFLFNFHFIIHIVTILASHELSVFIISRMKNIFNLDNHHKTLSCFV